MINKQQHTTNHQSSWSPGCHDYLTRVRRLVVLFVFRCMYPTLCGKTHWYGCTVGFSTLAAFCGLSSHQIRLLSVLLKRFLRARLLVKLRHEAFVSVRQRGDTRCYCVCELGLNLTLRKARGRGVIRVSNVSLIKVDTAEGGKEGRGRKEEEKTWRSKGRRVMRRKKKEVVISFPFFLSSWLSLFFPFSTPPSFLASFHSFFPCSVLSSLFTHVFPSSSLFYRHTPATSHNTPLVRTFH